MAEVRSTRLLEYVAYPIITFQPIEPPSFPQEWAEGTYWVNLKLFGGLPLGRQAIVISYPATESNAYVVRDLSLIHI